MSKLLSHSLLIASRSVIYTHMTLCVLFLLYCPIVRENY